MPPSTRTNWLALQEIIQKHLDFAPTTGELAKWVESGPALALNVDMSRATVYRLLKDKATAGIYGLVPVGKDERWTYSSKVVDRAKRELTKSAEAHAIIAESSRTGLEANAAAQLTRALSDTSVQQLTEEVDSLIKQKRAFAQDEVEQLILSRFREVRAAYGNEEMVSKATEHYIGRVLPYSDLVDLGSTEPKNMPIQLFFMTLASYIKENTE